MLNPQQPHLGGDQRVGRAAHFIISFKQQLPKPVQLPGTQALRPALDRLAFFRAGGISPALAQLANRDPVRQFERRAQQRQRLYPQRILLVHHLEQRTTLTRQQRPEQAPLRALVSQPQHIAHLIGGNLALAAQIGMRDRLIENRQPVAHRSFGCRRDHRQCFGFGADVFGCADHCKMFSQQRCLDAAQIEPLAAAEHGHRQLVDLGGGEEKLHMRRRLFQRLEQRIERVAAEHVDFIDNINLVARRDRRIAHRLDNFAHVVHPGVAGGVHFDHIDMPPLGNRHAGIADPARIDRRAALLIGANTVKRLGDQPCGTGLAHPAHAGHQEGMGQPVALDRIAQRLHHRVLAEQLGERLRAVFAREHAVRLRGGGGRCGGVCWLGRTKHRFLAGRFQLLGGRCGVFWFIVESVWGIVHRLQVRRSPGICRRVKRSRPTRRNPLWLLPSGPDQVGERKRPTDSRRGIWRRCRVCASLSARIAVVGASTGSNRDRRKWPFSFRSGHQAGRPTIFAAQGSQSARFILPTPTPNPTLVILNAFQDEGFGFSSRAGRNSAEIVSVGLQFEPARRGGVDFGGNPVFVGIGGSGRATGEG